MGVRVFRVCGGRSLNPLRAPAPVHRTPNRLFVVRMPSGRASPVKGRYADILARSVLALRAVLRMRPPVSPLTAAGLRTLRRRATRRTVH